MLTSSSSAVTRTPTSPTDAPHRARSAEVVDLAARRAQRLPGEPSPLRITPELLDALGGPGAALRRHL